LFVVSPVIEYLGDDGGRWHTPVREELNAQLTSRAVYRCMNSPKGRRRQLAKGETDLVGRLIQDGVGNGLPPSGNSHRVVTPRKDPDDGSRRTDREHAGTLHHLPDLACPIIDVPPATGLRRWGRASPSAQSERLGSESTMLPQPRPSA
jgi:hypothetical protein